MKTEIITICVNRTSFLRESLPVNKAKVDNVIVVTTPSDLETQAYCKLEKVDYVTTNAFYHNGDPFNKGLAIEEGIKALRHKDWVLLLDADIILSPPYGEILSSDGLDTNRLYGCRRVMISDKKEYLEFLRDCAFNPEKINLNDMLNERNDEIGVGYFQLFNMQSSVIKEIAPQVLGHSDEAYERLVQPYNEDSDRIFKQESQLYPGFPHAGGSDCIFRAFFAERQLFAVSHIPVVHLGAEAAGGHAGSNLVVFN